MRESATSTRGVTGQRAQRRPPPFALWPLTGMLVPCLSHITAPTEPGCWAPRLAGLQGPFSTGSLVFYPGAASSVLAPFRISGWLATVIVQEPIKRVPGGAVVGFDGAAGVAMAVSACELHDCSGRLRHSSYSMRQETIAFIQEQWPERMPWQ